VAIRDLNGDGHADLVTANAGDDTNPNEPAYTVSVLLGNGDRGFAANVDYGTGQAPVSVAIGDLNADGLPDLVTADNGSNTVSVLLNVRGLPTGVEGVDVPKVRLSASVIPNPLNPAGVIRFQTSRPGPAKVTVFDAQGRRVRVLMDAPSLPAGAHTVPVDGRGGRGQVLATGVYFYRVDTAEGSVAGKFTVLK